MEKLALHGGTPVRTTALPSDRLGVTLYGEEELKELSDVITSKMPFRHYGPLPTDIPDKTAQMEAMAREILGVKYTLALSSGSAALTCAMVAMDIGPGDEVILPAFGWYSDYATIVAAGALPVFASIDDTLNLDPADFERKITPRTKAVIMIHYQGSPARIDEIVAIARRNNVIVVEDVAQAFGGSYKGKRLGSYGDIAIASFQFNKMISCGEGGLLYTNNESYFARAVRHHDLGVLRPYFMEQLTDKTLADDTLHAFPGDQYRLSELHAAVMIAQFGKLETVLSKCRGYYSQLEAAFQGMHFQLRPTDPGQCGITCFMKFADKEEAKLFNAALTAEGVPTGATSACRNMMHLPMVKQRVMVSREMPPYADGYEGNLAVDRDWEGTAQRTDDVLGVYAGISIGPQYAQSDIDDIIAAVRKVDAHMFSQVKG